MTLPNEKKKFRSMFERQNQKTAKSKVKNSQKQEERLAGKLGGHRNRGSGNVRGTPWENPDRRGDVILKDFCIEAKMTSKKTYTINQGVVGKAYAEAMQEGKDWALAITIEGFDNPNVPNKFVMVDEDTFASMYQVWQEMKSLEESRDKEILKESEIE